MKTELSIIVTLHREGALAASSLLSVMNSANEAALAFELIMVLDSADLATQEVAQKFALNNKNVVLMQLECSDPGESRNAAVQVASGHYISIIDGDDLVSRNFFRAHISEAKALSDRFLVRPELLITFGGESLYNSQYDERNAPLPAATLFALNPWASPVLAHRSIFEAVPYSKIDSPGFGYEDWFWNCDLKAAGYLNAIAPKTAYFYRRKRSTLSRNTLANQSVSILPPNRLFDIEFSK